MFEKTLTDVVKGIRASKRDTALYISQCIAEIKSEINSSDMYVKANALQKLTFLQMMGYSMSWASFSSIEVMSSPRFAHKRIGYLAASQGFTQDTEVVLLTTNLLKKELRGAVGGGMHGVYEAGLAINCISNIVTEDLACDLLPELTNLTAHPQPYLRKKAILCLFKVFVKYPQGLRLTFAKLQQCLSDSNASVVSCAVNVITELSDKNPKNYLHLAPAFFDLLTQSSNNWMLIKVVKLLGSLVPEEPRLARKLLDPLATIVKNTQAKSLLYEAVHTITLCLPYCRKSDGSMPASVPEIVVLCSQILRSFVEESDQNLKYLGLVGFGSLMQSHPRVLSAPDYRPLILACLSDQDVTIRTRALDLLKGMTTQKNLTELVTQLLKHVDKATGNYKLDLVAKIIEMCSDDKYALLNDFAWYLDVLFQLGHVRGLENHADLLRGQIIDVALRVLPVRGYAVRLSIKSLFEEDIVSLELDSISQNIDIYGDNGRGKHIMPEILPSAAWIIGEYAELIPDARSSDDDDDESDDAKSIILKDDSKGLYHSVIKGLMSSAATSLPTSTQKVYVQAAMKVFAAAATDTSCTPEELEACLISLEDSLPSYMQSTDVEVAERSCSAIELVKSLVRTKSGFPHLATEVEVKDSNGDLFGLNGGSNGSSSMPASDSSQQRLRAAAPTLKYLFIPSPMKPVGAKAQRKKHANPTDAVIALINTLSLDFIDDFLNGEEEHRSKLKSSMDAVTFTQNHRRQVQEPVLSNLALPTGVDTSSTPGLGHSVPIDGSTSFQKPSSSTSIRRKDDPFYLDSAPKQSENIPEERIDSRFGTIQLLDSDDESPATGRRKKKDKKASRIRTNPIAKDLLAFENASGLQGTPAVLESDDDEDDNNFVSKAFLGGRRKGPSKEFEGLAQVDLTTPLRDDEVIPQRKHHTVAERQVDDARKGKSKRKSHKQKRKSSSKSAQGTVGDLLGLGGFDNSPTPPSGVPAVTNSTSSSRNPINDAFDDLLDISTPHLSIPPMLESVGVGASVPNDQDTKNLWLRATFKLSSEANSSTIAWSRVHLYYSVQETRTEGATAATVIFRVQNGAKSRIDNVIVDLRNFGQVYLGSIQTDSFADSEKLGPIPYQVQDTSYQCKGVLLSSGGQVPFKMSLPASAFLKPDTNAVLDTVAQEMSSGAWSSHSVKVEIASKLSIEDVKSCICTFFRAEEVRNGEVEPSVATFASSSRSSGSKVRVFMKVRERAVKIDIRCTNSNLGRGLASDLKRLVL